MTKIPYYPNSLIIIKSKIVIIQNILKINNKYFMKNNLKIEMKIHNN